MSHRCDARHRPASRPTSIVAAVAAGALVLLVSCSLAAVGGLNDRGTSDDGLSMAVILDRTEVAPGAAVAISVAIRNDRPGPVVLFLDGCDAPATVSATVPVPGDPPGRTWDGIAGAFKSYALTQGNGIGGTPPTVPTRVEGTAVGCSVPGDTGERTLAPGTSTNASFLWTADLVKGVPALPGEIAISVHVGHDPSGPPPSPPPGYTGVIGSWVKVYRQLTWTATIRIEGAAPRVLTPGQALDVMLADARFVTWLSEQPASTWSTANLLLLDQGPAQGIVPAGPLWEVDLFREMGVPRNWAIGFVDPFTGRLRGLTICDIPCDR
jgi:hypothetical protein